MPSRKRSTPVAATPSTAPAPSEAPRVPPTSAAVARAAGVSRTTVSFVLNGVTDRGISDATRERVLQAAQALGYEPNAAASTLVSGRTGTVALVLPSVQHLHVDAFLAQLLASVAEQCRRQGLTLLIEATDGEGQQADRFVRLVRGRRIDGLIVAHPRDAEREHLLRLQDSGVPLVVLGGGWAETHPGQVLGDDTRDGARRLTAHLLALGHRRVGFVNYASSEFRNAAAREQGWRDALLAQDVSPEPGWSVHANLSADSGWQATRALLARQSGSTRPTAIFAGNDTIAFGALRALREAGLRVPQDMALVGYDDIPLAAFADPPLTTVRSDPAGQGAEAVARLRWQLDGSRAPGAATGPVASPATETALPATLIVRASCGSQPG